MTTIGLAVLDNHQCLEVRILTDLTLRNAAEFGRDSIGLAGARETGAAGSGSCWRPAYRQYGRECVVSNLPTD
jgi:hypothetical protein